MDIFQSIAENRIREAQEEGLFENIPGKGQPFKFEDDAMIPEDLRLSHKILRNAQCLPPELELRKAVYNLRQMIEIAGSDGMNSEEINEESRKVLRQKLNRAILDLDLH